VLLVVALVGLRGANRDVHSYRVELAPLAGSDGRDGAVPAVVYEPGPARRRGRARSTEPLPSIVLGHGFAGNAGMMSSLARHFARAGYAVIAIDFTGHGHNTRPFAGAGASGRDLLLRDLEAAVLFARTQPHFDPERVSVVGHSMGGFAVLEYGSRDASLAATVAISAGAVPTGPYRVPNVLFIFASRDPVGLREGARSAGAQLAGLERLVVDRTYGEIPRGNAVRLSEVEGVDHLTILYSQQAAQRILEWIELSSGPGVGALPPAPDSRFGFALLGLLGALIVVSLLADAFAPLVPRVDLSHALPLPSLAALTAALVGTAVLLGGVNGFATSGPFGFVGIVAGGDLLGLFGIAGVALLVYGARRGEVRALGLEYARTWAVAGSSAQTSGCCAVPEAAACGCRSSAG